MRYSPVKSEWISFRKLEYFFIQCMLPPLPDSIWILVNRLCVPTTDADASSVVTSA